MRTVILVGLICVADAIRKDWIVQGQNTVNILSTLIVVVAFMDLVDFVKNNMKKN